MFLFALLKLELQNKRETFIFINIFDHYTNTGVEESDRENVGKTKEGGRERQRQ